MYLNGEVEGLTYDVSDNIDDYSNRIVKAQIARDLSLNWKSEHLVDSPTPHQNKKKNVLNCGAHLQKAGLKPMSAISFEYCTW